MLMISAGSFESASEFLVSLEREFSHDAVVSRRGFHHCRIEQLAALTNALRRGDEARLQENIEGRLGLPLRVPGSDLLAAARIRAGGA